MTSQHGEDAILSDVFKRLGVENGTCVEFGAWDGKKNSNTHDLIMNHGWRGIQIEASAERFESLIETYRDRPDVMCLNRLVGFDSPDTLDEILAATGIPVDFDLLSIDIDGNDYHVFESVREFHPKGVIIEFNPSFPNHVLFVQPRRMNCNQGTAIRSINELARSKGYELVATTICNAIFVRRDLFPRMEVPDNSLSTLHSDVSFQTHILQLYDGTLLLTGCRFLIWHAVGPIVVPQVLPEQLRKFPNALRGSHK